MEKGFIKNKILPYVTIFLLIGGLFLEGLALSGTYHVFRMKNEKDNLVQSGQADEETKGQIEYCDSEINRVSPIPGKLAVAGGVMLGGSAAGAVVSKILDKKEEEEEEKES